MRVLSRAEQRAGIRRGTHPNRTGPVTPVSTRSPGQEVVALEAAESPDVPAAGLFVGGTGTSAGVTAVPGWRRG